MALHCVSCGCTNDNACPGGCSWVSMNPPVCSACVEAEGANAEAFDRGLLSDDCPASSFPAPHKMIYTSSTECYCVACKEPFFAAEAA